MSQLSQSRLTSGQTAVRPALITTIACLELAAALWDARQFLKLDAIFPLTAGDVFSWNVLMPALMCIAAIYAGVGLLQMRSSAWAVWMARHAWLAGFYLLSLPTLMAESVYCPALSLHVTWRFTMVLFSVLSGAYLCANRKSFNR